MRKVILDLRGLESRRELHTYIAEKMDFPEYYGKNLDALYDCLTDIGHPTAIGILLPTMEDTENHHLDEEPTGYGDIHHYIHRMRRTFADAEMSNPNLAVLDLNIQ